MILFRFIYLFFGLAGMLEISFRNPGNTDTLIAYFILAIVGYIEISASVKEQK